MLTPQRLTAHLLLRGLLPPDVIDRGLTIVGRRRNNHNFEVRLSAHRGYFAKQSTAGDAVAAEAQFYEAVAAGGGGGLRRHLPAFCDYDRDRKILVLRLVANAKGLAESVTRNRRLAARLGTAVAAIHEFDVRRRNVRRVDVPWVFSLPAPGIEFLSDITPANLAALRIVQRSAALCGVLERLRGNWRETTLIHGDLRFENCLVSKRGRTRSALTIVDWEMAGNGDPSWDVGCVFAALVSMWVGPVGVARQGRRVRSAGVPLPRVKRAAREFWAAYSRDRRFGARDARSFVLESVRSAAARLVQSAFEALQFSHSLSREAVVLLQLAANVAARPHQASSVLLGIRA